MRAPALHLAVLLLTVAASPVGAAQASAPCHPGDFEERVLRPENATVDTRPVVSAQFPHVPLACSVRSVEVVLDGIPLHATWGSSDGGFLVFASPPDHLLPGRHDVTLRVYDPQDSSVLLSTASWSFYVGHPWFGKPLHDSDMTTGGASTGALGLAAAGAWERVDHHATLDPFAPTATEEARVASVGTTTRTWMQIHILGQEMDVDTGALRIERDVVIP